MHFVDGFSLKGTMLAKDQKEILLLIGEARSEKTGNGRIFALFNRIERGQEASLPPASAKKVLLKRFSQGTHAANPGPVKQNQVG